MKFDKQEIIKEYGGSESNSGDTKAQIALLTKKIAYLTDHLKDHRKDFASRVGLMKTIGQRKRLLNYLKSNKYEEYQNLIKELGIRR